MSRETSYQETVTGIGASTRFARDSKTFVCKSIVAPDGKEVRKTFVQVVVRPLLRFCTEIFIPSGASGK
jgi:hypothetical protein